MIRQSIALKTAIIVLLLGLPLAAKAQARVAASGGSPAMNYSRELLKRADVQNELGLDAKQKETLAKLLDQPFGKIVVRIVPVKVQDLSKLSAEERKKCDEEIARQAEAQAVAQMNEQKREVEDVLTDEQLRRLNEIDLQWRGILALSDKNLSDKLGISPDRQSQIRAILNDFEVKRITLWGEREDLQYQKRLELVLITEQKVLALLSDDEKARWTQATGKPFSFEK